MSKRPERPNLLFIFSDQQRADTMAAYGNDWIDTPGDEPIGRDRINNRELLRVVADLHTVTVDDHDGNVAAH